MAHYCLLFLLFVFIFSDGIIFINQTSIPGSNIFEIFPFLFKSYKPKTIPGLLDFVTKIVEMGLENLIVVSKHSALKNSTSKEVSLNTSRSEKWWFLN
jgi:hypothetical protein